MHCQKSIEGDKTHTYSYTLIHTHIHTHTHAHMHTHTCMHSHTCTHTQSRAHTCTHAHTHTHMCAHTDWWDISKCWAADCTQMMGHFQMLGCRLMGHSEIPIHACIYELILRSVNTVRGSLTWKSEGRGFGTSVLQRGGEGL